MHITKQQYDEFVRKGLLPPIDQKTAKAATDRYKSKAERLMAAMLEDAKSEQSVHCWDYEPITFVVADMNGVRARYTPDFFVVYRQHGRAILHFIEVKGFLREAARVRFLAAAERYPFFAFSMLRLEKGAWKLVLGEDFFLASP